MKYYPYNYSSISFLHTSVDVFLMRRLQQSSILFVVILLLLFTTTTTNAVLNGDEQYQNKSGGRFWTFHSAGVSIVNADTCQLEHTFRFDNKGKSLPEKWNDGVYMEKSTKQVEDEDDNFGYILIMSGVTTYGINDNSQNEIIIMTTNPKYYDSTHGIGGYYYDTNTGKGGGGPIQWRRNYESANNAWRYYSYGLYTRDEFWIVGDGQIFIVPLSSVITQKQITIQTKSFFKTKTNTNTDNDNDNDDDNDDNILHGMLLWDESNHLSNHGYISGGGGGGGRDSDDNKILHIVDLNTKIQRGIFNYSSYVDKEECTYGVRGIAYSSLNKHLYLSCGWTGPILEIDLGINPDQPTFVTKHYDVGGTIQEINNLIVAIDHKQNILHIFLLSSSSSTASQASSLEYQVSVPGRADKVSFYGYHHDVISEGKKQKNDGDENIICMPLTENVNRNNMDVNGNIVCDVFDCGPPETPQDVAAGMCLWDTNNTNELLKAPLDDFDKVLSGDEPYLNRCPRCKDRASYRGGDVCTCTPHCGSCASPNYDVSKTGVRCIKVQEILIETDADDALPVATLIPGAGAIIQEGQSFYGKQCGYGWGTHRSSTRGGKYHVSIANFPSNSLQIVDMTTQSLHCQVDLPGEPNRVIYVPPQPNQEKSYNMKKNGGSGGGLSQGGMIAAIVIATLGFMLIIVLFTSFFCRRSNNNDRIEKTTGDNMMNADLELTPSSSPSSSSINVNNNSEVPPLPEIT